MNWTHYLTLALATVIPVAIQGSGFIPPPYGVIAAFVLTAAGNYFHLITPTPGE